MSIISSNCGFKADCRMMAVILSIAVGILVAFLRITAVIIVTPVALSVAFGIAVAYLAVTFAVSARVQTSEDNVCLCQRINTVLVGALGTIFTSVLLLGITFVATSILGAIITGILAASFTVLLTGTACLIRCITGCSSNS